MNNRINIISEKFLSNQQNVEYTNEYIVKDGKKYQKVRYGQKLPYQATLRNLRNIIEADVSPEAIKKVCDYLSNETAVKKSKQFPFRFLSAYRMLLTDCKNNIYSKKILSVLEKAVSYSTSSMTGLNEHDRVLIASDVSGSMQQHRIGGKNSIVTAYDVGLLLSMALRHRCEFVESGFFGDRWKVVDLPSDRILHNVIELYRREGEVGYSTNGYLVIDWALKNQKQFDKIMIFTDCEMYGGSIQNLWNRYYSFMNQQTKLYLFDLSGYQTTPLRIEKNGVFRISGFSDKIFEMMDALENGSSIVEEIRKIEI